MANASILVLAGSETTATLLSGTFYLLGTHPEVLAKVVDEVRSKFASEEEIDLISVNSLDYMLACLKEAFRQYPPVAGALARVVPRTGGNISGQWIPGNVSAPRDTKTSPSSPPVSTQPSARYLLPLFPMHIGT